MEEERRQEEACEGGDIDGRNDAIVVAPPPTTTTSNAAAALHPAVSFPGSLLVRGWRMCQAMSKWCRSRKCASGRSRRRDGAPRFFFVVVSLFSARSPRRRRRKKNINRSTPPRSRSWPSTGSPLLSPRPSRQRRQPRKRAGPFRLGSTSRGGRTPARTSRSWPRSLRRRRRRRRRPLLLRRRPLPPPRRLSLLRLLLLRGCSRRLPPRRWPPRGGSADRPSQGPRRSSPAEGSR